MFKIFLSIFILGGLAFPGNAFDVPTVQYPAKALKPGQTLVVEINSSYKAPVLIWDETHVPFYYSHLKKWRALVRVPLDQEPGETTLFVISTLGPSGKNVCIPFQASILPSDFGFEELEFSAEKSKLLNDPSEDEESKLIRVFLKKAENHKDQLWSGDFIKPVPGPILSEYGLTRKKKGQTNLDFHRGVDLKADKGESIVAPNGAMVLMVRNFKFHGKTVLLSHGQGIGSITIHMDTVSVKEGQKLNKGDMIGTVGSTGLATAPHVHWGIYVHRKAVNPTQWLEEQF